MNIQVFFIYLFIVVVMRKIFLNLQSYIAKFLGYDTQVPGSKTYSLALYYMISNLQDAPLLQSFVDRDDAYRNSRFKLIPYISKVSIQYWSRVSAIGKCITFYLVHLMQLIAFFEHILYSYSRIVFQLKCPGRTSWFLTAFSYLQ